MKVIQAVLMHTVLTCCASVTYMEDFDSVYSWQKRLHSRLSASINMFTMDPPCLAFNFFPFSNLYAIIFQFFLQKTMFLYKILVISLLLH